MRWNRVLLFCLCFSAAQPATAQQFALTPFAGERILFLGDSNTYAGGFVITLESYLRTRFPDAKWDLVNLGLPSETISGLSEADHPYPRPNVHERLERILSKLEPQPRLVIVCYGMNDGIYAPFSDERHAKYTAGLEKLVKVFEKIGARVVLMSPAPFDPTPVQRRLLPLDTKERFSYLKPYANYDDVLARYAKDLLAWRAKGYLVVDAHSGVHRFLKHKREWDPKYTLSGDGIHPNATGHALIALEILRTLNAPSLMGRAVIDAKNKQAKQGDVTNLKASNDEFSFVWKSKLPMPIDPAWDEQLLVFEKISDQFNRQELQVSNLPGKDYELWDGKTRNLGSVTSEQLAKGINLAAYPLLSTHKRSLDLMKKVQQSNTLLSRAWLDHVGHKRPDTPKGLRLDQAKKQAAPILAEIERLQQPVELEIRLVRKE